MIFAGENRERWDVALLALISFALMLTPLVHKFMWDVGDEVRYADVAREMATSGNYIVPTIANQPVPFYPPLGYWLISLSAFCCGGFTPFSVTLPIVVAAVGCMVIVYAFGALLWGRRAAIIAALILLGVNGFTTAASLCRADMIMIFFQLFGIFLFFRWYMGRDIGGKRFPFFRFYLSLVCATLSKGPQALVVTPAIILLFLLWRKDWKALGAIHPWTGILFTLACVSPWYIYVQLSTGANVLFNENLDVFLGRGYRETGMQSRPPFHYLPIIFARSFPWIFFFPSAIMLLRRDEKDRLAETPRTNGYASFFIIWFLTILVFYSLAAAKRYYYITLIYPMVALAVARYWDWAWERKESRRSAIIIYSLLSLMVAGTVLGLYLFPDRIPNRDILSHIDAARLTTMALFFVSIVCLILFLLRKVWLSIAVMCGLAFAGHFAYYLIVYPAIVADKRDAVNEFRDRYRKVAGENPEIYAYRFNPVVSPALSAISFYLEYHFRAIEKPEDLDRLAGEEREFYLVAPEAEYLEAKERFKAFDVLYNEPLPADLLSGRKILLLRHHAP